MKNRKFLSPRMNAFWFTYTSIFLFSMLPEFGINLSLLKIVSGGLLSVIIVNTWNLNNEKPIMDERKQKNVTEAMAWAFAAVSLIIISAATTHVEINRELLKSISEMSLWTWIMVFSGKMLYQQYRGE